MDFIIENLLDIIIVIVCLTVLIGSFFKPTYRYVRWLTGLFFAALVVLLVKNVNVLNFIESYFVDFANLITFDVMIHNIFVVIGKQSLLGTPIFDMVHNLTLLASLGLVVFIIVNLLMGITHKLRVGRLIRKGRYIYNKPFGSFLLAMLIVVIGLITTTTIASLPFETNYVGQSVILTTTSNLLTSVFNTLRSFIPQIPTYESLVDLIAGIRVGMY